MNKPIKVCLSSLFFPPDFSGAGLRFQRYMPGLAERGIHFTVFAGEFGEQPPTSTPLSTSEYLSIQRVPMSKALDKHSLRQYLKAIIDYCSHPDTRPDILHFLSTKSAWFALYPSLYRLNLPIIYSHTLINKRPKSRIKRFIYPFIERFTLSIADQIIVNSQQAKRQYKDSGITKKIVYIPNGVDLERFHPVRSSNDKQKIRKKINLPAEIPIVIFVGSISPRKGVDILIESWRILVEQNPNTLLLLVGPTAREYSKYSLTYHTYIEKLLTQISVSNKVIMTGQVSNVVDYLKSSDIFVFTSLNEGMPNAVLEAYSCGLPCVLTKFDGLEATLGKSDIHYILAERKPLKIANAILDLLNRPEKASRLGREARLFAEQTLNIETTLDLYAQAYFGILNSVHSDAESDRF